ncbi:hypothetical protein GYMLUDRAFT_995418 [Collybiopsis luxurians FD-317 M1]|uniref:Helicase ATP-binding domain-containing protein n=1 Tax=Collybiopsis luxurians FD-317 M1 TaxID=944289 RepID=A0A0D0C140_9AGAR|nr:hypothetical protein GYMLUDRAFT_995418 [Collybiopsis luxurians FD-317 M1]
MFNSPVPPNYYISVISDRWLHAEMRLPISFTHLILPEKFPSPTPLLDLQPLPLSALPNKEFERIYEDEESGYRIEMFNKNQTQVFQALYTSNENIFIGAPMDSGKTICVEFALLHLWSKCTRGQAVCIKLFQEMVDMRVQEWKAKFGSVQGGRRLLEKGDIIICTPSQWDVLSRHWHQCKNVQTVALLIADEVHLIGGECETAGYGHPPPVLLYNPFPLTHARNVQACISCYLRICSFQTVTIFVLSKKQCQLMEDDLLLHAAAEEKADRLLYVDVDDLEVHLERLADEGLKEMLRHGVGYFHEALSKQDKRIVRRLFESSAAQVLVALKDTAWSLPVSSYVTIIMGVQYYEGKEHRYIDYPVMDVLLSKHLLELVKTTLTDLMNSKCIAIEDKSDEVSPLNLGMIAAYYDISYCADVTVEVYMLSLKEHTKLRGLLEVVSSVEFEIVPICQHEDILLCRLHKSCLKLEKLVHSVFLDIIIAS